MNSIDLTVSSPQGDAVRPPIVGYRPDIDGLRAIAVSAVVFFHAGGETSSGYLGVDMFFVISGYLIASIIAREHQAGNFSYISFWERRIRRILPALFVMLAVTALVSYRILAPDELKLFAGSLIAAVLFASNFFFWSKTGYFDAPAEVHPLLHTWSLAIEEQYYLLFPLLFVLAARRSRSALVGTLAMLGLASFALAVWLGQADANAAFYASPARVWELLLGAMLALGVAPVLKSQLAREVTSLGCFAILLGSLTFAQAGFMLPGVAGALPCLATAGLIHAGAGARTWVATLLGTAPLVGLGRISYSLYLWHWPALALARAYLDRAPTGITLAAIVLATVLVSIGSYYFVEQPWRHRGGVVDLAGLFSVAGVVAASALTFGGIVIHNGGFANRYPGSFVIAPIDYRAPKCMLSAQQKQSEWAGADCLVNAVRSPVVMFWGDSYSAHYIPALIARREELKFNVLQYNLGACAPVLGYDMVGRPDCRMFNDGAKAIIERFGVKVVVLAANWSGYKGRGSSLADLTATIAALRAQGLAVVVIGQSPSFRIPVPKIYWWRTRNQQEFKSEFEADTEVAINIELKRIAGSSLFLDPSLAFCKANKCTIGAPTKPYFVDKGHFTEDGGKRALDSFWAEFESYVLAVR